MEVLTPVTVFPCLGEPADEWDPSCRRRYIHDERRPSDMDADFGADAAAMGHRHGDATKAAIVLLKLWKYDFHPTIRSHHIVWGVLQATKIIGVNFAHDSGTWRGRVLLIMVRCRRACVACVFVCLCVSTGAVVCVCVCLCVSTCVCVRVFGMPYAFQRPLYARLLRCTSWKTQDTGT